MSKIKQYDKKLNYTLVFIAPNALIGTEFDRTLYTAHVLVKEYVGLSATLKKISKIYTVSQTLRVDKTN